MQISTVIVDDDDEVRSAMCAVIEDDDRFVVIGQAADRSGALAAVQAHPPDLILLDLRMPGGGIDTARQISADYPSVTIVVVSAQVDGAQIATLLELGVRGVFVKGRLGRNFLDLVVGCQFGEVMLATPAAAEGLKLLAGGRLE